MALSDKNELYGVLLAGGSSVRMGKDKAQLRYGNRSQLEIALDLAGRHCSRVFLSLRQDQAVPIEAKTAGIAIIRDPVENTGPLAGILAALQEHPGKPWLILAVDLPFLNSDTLDYLINNRDADCPFTAFNSNFDGLPEPLCAIYEPMALPLLQDFFHKRGNRCPRKIMMQTNPKMLQLPSPHARALDNINTPDDYKEAIQRLNLINQ